MVMVFAVIVLSACAKVPKPEPISLNNNIAVVAALGNTAEVKSESMLASDSRNLELPELNLNESVSNAIQQALLQNKRNAEIIYLTANNPLYQFMKAKPLVSDYELEPRDQTALREVLQNRKIDTVILITRNPATVTLTKIGAYADYTFIYGFGYYQRNLLGINTTMMAAGAKLYIIDTKTMHVRNAYAVEKAESVPEETFPNESKPELAQTTTYLSDWLNQAFIPAVVESMKPYSSNVQLAEKIKSGIRKFRQAIA